MPKTIPYYGGKMRLAPRIAELVGTDHRNYVEPFAGSAAVLMRKSPSRVEVLNDLDREVMNFWRVLRTRPDELIAALRLTPYSKAEYTAADFQGDEVERARHFVIRSCMSFSGTHTGGYSGSNPRSRDVKGRKFVRFVDERLPQMAERIRHVELDQRDALAFLDKWDSPETAAYVDPPYMAGVRVAPNCYRLEADGTDYHRELLKRLNDFSGRVVLSGYESELYADELDEAKWSVHKVNVQAASGAGRGTSTRRTECLWVKEANR